MFKAQEMCLNKICCKSLAMRFTFYGPLKRAEPCFGEMFMSIMPIFSPS
jgi:hypothetical protein